MSGVNLSSLPTKFDTLENSSLKMSPVSKAKAKDSSSSIKPSANDDAKDFSRELIKQEEKISYSKPQARPVEERLTEPSASKSMQVEDDLQMDTGSLVVTPKKQGTSEMLEMATESQQPLLKFLDSMERELGVDAESVLAAFAMMSNEALLLPQEQSTEEFVGSLGLAESELPIAKQLYGNMLQEIARRDLEVPVSDGGLLALNTNEWDLLPKQEALPKDWKLLQAQQQSEDVVALSNKFFNVSEEAKRLSAIESEPTWLQQTNFALDPSLHAELDAATATDLETLDLHKMNLSSELRMPGLRLANSEGDPSFDMHSESGAGENLTELSLDSESVDVEGGQVFSTTQDAPTTKLQAVTATAVQEIPQHKDVKPEDIVKQTDLLIKKGGGEVKMKLNPEGLGEVHLKVVLQEGKVDIQMITESQQAKKAIESELMNLKTVLAEAKMDLKDIKVDVAQNMSRQMQDQLADQQREHARQFLHHFRENFGSGRSAMAYAGAGKVQNSEDPSDVVRVSSQQRRAYREPGRLSVVA